MRLAIPFVIVLLAAGGCRAPGTTDAPATPIHLLLVTIDTMRADRLGRGFTPTLDALAARGLSFAQARTVAPLTLPAHVSMMTGARPPDHGVRVNGVVFAGTPAPAAVQLKARGYRTAAFVGAYVLDRRFGLSVGFDHYDDHIPRNPNAVEQLEAERPAQAVADRAIAWVRGLPAQEGRERKPLFLWVHFYDPHAPYTPPADARQRAGGDAYNGEIAAVDAQLGRLFTALDEAGYRDRLTIAVGDHGESLGEHGERTHGMLLYEPAVRVPLIVAGSGVAAARRTNPVSIAQVHATLLGTRDSLLGPPDGEREVYLETEYPRAAGWSPLHALVHERWKVIVSSETELYDLSSDGQERASAAPSRPAAAQAMARRVDALRTATVAAAKPSNEASDRLRALGYVTGASPAAASGTAPNPARTITAWTAFEDALAAPNPAASLAPLKALAEQHPDARVFQAAYARALTESGGARAALLLYRRLVTRWSDDAMLFHEMAIAARNAGELDEALRAEHAALALDPALPAAHNGIGLLHADAGAHAAAIESFARAATLDPTNAPYRVNLGNARRAAGDLTAAAEAYRTALGIDPDNADAANGMGVLLVQQQRAAEAVPFFERALRTTPGFVEARLNLGIALQESGQAGHAKAAYQQVLAAARPGSRERRAAAELLRSLP